MDSSVVALSPEPREAGLVYGRLAGGFIRERLGRMWDVVRTGGASQGEVEERGREFRRIAQRIAPEWLDEAQGIAEGAGVEADDLLILNALPTDFWPTPGCTTLVATGSCSAEGATLLHKNRDLRNEVQTFEVRRLADGQVFASREVGSLGYGHFHSDRALAGANNTGSPIPERELRPCGLTCAHLLRLVAERAGSCDEALATLDLALSREVAGGSGGTRGMVFIFAEPQRAVVAEMTSRRMAYREIEDDALVRTNHFILKETARVASEPPSQNTTRRFERASEILAGLDALSVGDLLALARDHADGPDSICSADAEHPWMTVSACTHLVRPNTSDPLAHTRAMMGNPRNTLAIPVPRAIDGLPQVCVSGMLHDLARRLYAARGLGDHLAAIQREREQAMADELASAKQGPPELLRERLTAMVGRWVEATTSLLREEVRKAESED